MVKEAVEKIFRAATFSAQEGNCTVVYEALEHVILDQIRTPVLGETNDKHLDH